MHLYIKFSFTSSDIKYRLTGDLETGWGRCHHLLLHLTELRILTCCQQLKSNSNYPALGITKQCMLPCP